MDVLPLRMTAGVETEESKTISENSDDQRQVECLMMKQTFKINQVG